MGLRSLARDHKEIVASEGLRGLIGTLSRDREDLDTVKVVLETLLQLFVGDDVDVGICCRLGGARKEKGNADEMGSRMGQRTLRFGWRMSSHRFGLILEMCVLRD